MKALRDVVRLLRPLDWSKNLFVFAGLLFSHAWDDPDRVLSVLRAFVAFCAVASSVYALNDVVDRERDARHPTKRTRPVASGAVSPGVAIAISMALAGCGLWIAASVSQPTFLMLAAYVLLNVGYSLRFKHIPILDGFVTASGFVLRVLTGTTGVAIPPSPWILICSLTLALFLSFSKRHAELTLLKREGGDPSDQVVSQYDIPILNQLIGICGACVILSYCLYTIDRQSADVHGTKWFIATTPFVTYGVLRYIHSLMRGKNRGDPIRELAGDPHLSIAVVGWLITTLLLLIS